MSDVIQTYWAQLLTAAAVIIWSLRLEGAVKAHNREIERLWKQREEDQRAHKEARDTTNRMLEEMRADIKLLLQRRLE